MWKDFERCKCNFSTDFSKTSILCIQPQKPEHSNSDKNLLVLHIYTSHDISPAIPVIACKDRPGVKQSHFQESEHVQTNMKSCLCLHSSILPALGLSGFLSGWHVRAFCRYAFLTCQSQNWDLLVSAVQSVWRKATWGKKKPKTTLQKQKITIQRASFVVGFA